MNQEQLRETLVRELFAAGDAARSAGEASSDLADRVHRFRKALRRARATLDLVAEAIPPRRARAALRSFRDARRAVSVARDHAVAPHVLGQLVLDDVQRATANEIVVAASSKTPEPASVEHMLRVGAAAAVAAIEEVGMLVPPAIGWSVPRAGLRRIYREARRARIDAKHDREAFHKWRRRTKELSYQLDLLGAPAHLDPIVDAQSLAVDLIMAVAFIRAHSEASDLDAVTSLVAHLEQQTAAQMLLARREGRDQFHAKPRDYVRGIRDAVSATTM